MSKPHLEIVPDPTADAMAALGASTIAAVLGTYRDLLDERDGLLAALLQEHASDTEAWAEESTELFVAWGAAKRRLWLYQLLAHEVRA